mmetsp:Transcript_29725/g.40015  ORF Transcript_29725/g.40015 Transcript_29725/m.40015 type:complete len:318 (+) Transcript_29725:52-1005(+)
MAGADVEEGFVDISQEKDGGLLKKILVEGTGDECPPEGSSVDVHYVGTLHSDGSKFDSSRDRPGTFNFNVGVGQVIKGWDQGILTMKKGEKAILRCTSDYAYGDSGSPPTIPGGATLNFEVELFSWKEEVKPPSEMSSEERVAHAMKMKEEGTAAFKVGDLATAVNRWEDGVHYLTFDPSQDFAGHSHGGMPCSGHGDDAGGDDAAEPLALSDGDRKTVVALLNNCAMAKLKLGDEDSAKFDCNKVLEYDAANVKALFRRGQAELAMGEYSKCAESTARVLELDPQNKEAEQLRRKAKDDEKKSKQKEKAMYSKMFG